MKLLVVLIGPSRSGKTSFARQMILETGGLHVELDKIKSPKNWLTPRRIMAMRGADIVIFDGVNPVPKYRRNLLAQFSDEIIKIAVVFTPNTTWCPRTKFDRIMRRLIGRWPPSKSEGFGVILSPDKTFLWVREWERKYLK